jgi:hypothetical protein
VRIGERNYVRLGRDGQVPPSWRDWRHHPHSCARGIEMIDVARQIQVVQAKHGDVTVKLVLSEKGGELSPPKRAMVQSVFDRYLPGITFTIQIVDDIPLTAGGKRRLVMTEMSV